MNRVIRERDLDAIYVTGPGHGGPGLVANAYLEGTYSEVYPHIAPRRGRAAAAVPAVLVPRRHPQPRRARDAGLDPRGRRARLRAGPRLRRRVRQPRPARLLRRRRRRGRDRPAGGQLALQQVPRPGHATARCCRSCTSTATRSPTPRCWRASPRRSCAALLEGYGYDAALRRGRRPGDGAPAAGRGARRGARRDRRDPAAPRASDGATDAAALADDRAAHARRAGPARRWSTACRSRARWRAHQVPLAETRTNPEHLALLEEWLRSYRPEELFDDDGALMPELAALAADGRAADERQPARQRRPAAARPRAARLPRLRRRRRPRRRRRSSRGDPRARAVPARRRSRRNPRQLPARSGPTRPRPTGWAPSSRSPTARGTRERCDGDDHLAPDGRVMEVLSRAPVPGLAGGLPADRPARPVQLLRGVHPHRRLDVQPARQVAEGHRGASRGGGRSPR